MKMCYIWTEWVCFGNGHRTQILLPKLFLTLCVCVQDWGCLKSKQENDLCGFVTPFGTHVIIMYNKNIGNISSIEIVFLYIGRIMLCMLEYVVFRFVMAM